MGHELLKNDNERGPSRVIQELQIRLFTSFPLLVRDHLLVTFFFVEEWQIDYVDLEDFC